MPLQLSPPGGSPPTHPTPRSGAASSCAESSPPSSSASPLDHHLREHAAHHRHIVILLLLLLLLLAASSVGEGAAGAPCSKKLPITRRTTTPRRCSRERFILPHTSAAFAEGRCLVGRAGGAWGGGVRGGARRVSRTSSGAWLGGMRFGSAAAHAYAKLRASAAAMQPYGPAPSSAAFK